MSGLLVLVGHPGNYTGYVGLTAEQALAHHVALLGDGPWDVVVIDTSRPFWVYDAASVSA